MNACKWYRIITFHLLNFFYFRRKCIGFEKNCDFRFSTDLYLLEGPELNLTIFRKVSVRNWVCLSVSVCVRDKNLVAALTQKTSIRRIRRNFICILCPNMNWFWLRIGSGYNLGFWVFFKYRYSSLYGPICSVTARSYDQSSFKCWHL